MAEVFAVILGLAFLFTALKLLDRVAASGFRWPDVGGNARRALRPPVWSARQVQRVWFRFIELMLTKGSVKLR